MNPNKRTKRRLEEQENIELDDMTPEDRIYREGDWINRATNPPKTYDGVTPQSSYYNIDDIKASIADHRLKQGVDYIVLDVSELTPVQAQEVLNYANSLTWPEGPGYPNLLPIPK